ncbi:MAG: M15 family metallopeptidase [Gemmatimonadaceae bacterium]
MTLALATRDSLLGLTDAHLCSLPEAEKLGARIHRGVVDSFHSLREASRTEGFDLVILSGYRSFEQQLSIWNRKATGQLAVLDSEARPLDIGTLSKEALVFAILRWSALPGGSRHHWGTDIDVYDAAARPEGYEIDLIPEEVESGGMFAPLHEWLDTRMASGSALGFFRPYDVDRGGVAPERWHLSHAPVATAHARLLSPDRLRHTIEGADMRLKDVVLAHLPVIFERFVVNTNPSFS